MMAPHFTAMNLGGILYGGFLAAMLLQVLEVIWYSDFLFGRVWRRGLSVDKAHVHARERVRGFAMNAVLSFAQALLIALLLNTQGVTDWWDALFLGGLLALLIAMVQGVHYVYEKRSLSFYLVLVGYPLLAYPLVSVLLTWMMAWSHK